MNSLIQWLKDELERLEDTFLHVKDLPKFESSIANEYYCEKKERIKKAIAEDEAKDKRIKELEKTVETLRDVIARGKK